MKSRKFPSYADAKAYMKERGELKYFGVEGVSPEKYVYTLTIGVIVYHLFVDREGLVEVFHQRYKD